MGFHPLKTISAALPLDHLAIDLKEYPKLPVKLSTNYYKDVLVIGIHTFRQYNYLST
jgi:hypothetical protein